jgi:hypothetical protein
LTAIVGRGIGGAAAAAVADPLAASAWIYAYDALG